MAQEIEIGVILEDAARLAGHQPQYGIPESWKSLAALQLNYGLRELAAEKFPMMMRYEFRRYRPTWDESTTYLKGNEVWHQAEGESDGDYYKCLVPSTSGTMPSQTPEVWQRLEMGEVAAFVSWEQPWRALDMDRASVDYTDFAFEEDPRYNPTAPAIPDCRISEMGVLIGKGAPKGVWCKFIPVFPQLSFVEWNEAIGYAMGKVVYSSTTKDCYLAVSDVAAGVNPASDDGSHWQPLRVHAEFQAYLTRLVAVDLLTEDQGKYQTRARAQAEFDLLCERYVSGVGQTRARVGSFLR